MYEIIRIILTIVIVTITFLLTNYLGLFGFLIGIFLLGITFYITKKSKPSLIRVITVTILSILIITILVIIINLMINYLNL